MLHTSNLVTITVCRKAIHQRPAPWTTISSMAGLIWQSQSTPPLWSTCCTTSGKPGSLTYPSWCIAGECQLIAVGIRTSVHYLCSGSHKLNFHCVRNVKPPSKNDLMNFDNKNPLLCWLLRQTIHNPAGQSFKVCRSVLRQLKVRYRN